MTVIGICGDDCEHCPRYIASKSGDVEKLKAVAAIWKRIGWRDKILSPEEIACNGCKTVSWCRYNDIRECAQKKDLDNCGDCEVYPCKIILNVFDKTASYSEECKKTFSNEDYDSLYKAFFSKKEKLDRIHNKKFNKKT